jgi:hypothetical protein
VKLQIAVASIVTAAALGLAGCTSSSAVPMSMTTPKPPPKSALEQWKSAYQFLSAQKKPTEINCLWINVAADGTKAAAQRPVEFYSFADSADWKSHTITRFDAYPVGSDETCEANVPTTVPYGPAIESFLNPLGLTFWHGQHHAAGLTLIEIAYAGQNSSDPDIIYFNQPGLFGLRIALTPLATSGAFVSNTSKIVQPTDDATAAKYLKYAKPLLAWYGYRG